VNDRYPRISPDGTQVVFASNRDRDDGGYELYVQSLAGGAPLRVTTFESGNASGPQWSPDGRMILFFSNMNRTNDIYAVRLDDGVIAPIRNTAAEERWPIWGK
jgi:Tol biopolymer transport system component